MIKEHTVQKDCGMNVAKEYQSRVLQRSEISVDMAAVGQWDAEML